MSKMKVVPLAFVFLLFLCGAIAQFWFISEIYVPSVAAVAASADADLGVYIENALDRVLHQMMVWPIACLGLLLGLTVGTFRTEKREHPPE